MTDLKTKYNKLTNKIFNIFVFYLPLSIVPEEIVKEDTDCFYAKYFDKLIFTDNGGIAINPEEIEIDKILQQSANLSDNAFKIVQYKKSLVPSDFNYLIGKYLEQLRFYNRVAELLMEYYEINCPKKSTNIYSAFFYQTAFFKNHLAEIEKIIEVNPIKVIDAEIFNQIKKSNYFGKLKKEKQQPEISYFREHILHDKKDDIEKILIDKYPKIKGIKIRYLIDHFEEIGLLSIYYGKRKELYESLKKSFNGNIGQYNSIFGFENNKVNNPDYKSFKKELNILLQKFIS